MNANVGIRGWRDLQEVFRALGETERHVVLRNGEMLPGGFDPSPHGDIDLLVENRDAVADLLRVRKVPADPRCAHYEITVADRLIRINLRFVGDGYYCEQWERDILKRRRRTASGVWIPSATDGFYSLVYHALYQKLRIVPDYREKAAALAREAGIPGDSFEDWLPLLEDFLRDRGYPVTRPLDVRVRCNARLVEWRKYAGRICGFCAVDGLRPMGISSPHGTSHLPQLLFSGRWNGRPCVVKYALKGAATIRNEWTASGTLRETLGENCVDAWFWQDDGKGGAFVVLGWIDGVPFSEFAARAKAGSVPPAALDRAAADCLKIVQALKAKGIVHRDIRPDNLMVADDGRVCIFDFQLSADRAHPVECGFLAARHFEILSKLGRPYAVADGIWNDWSAMAVCLELLPSGDVRDRVLSELRTGAAGEDFVACLPRRMRRSLVMRLVLVFGCECCRRVFRGMRDRSERLRHLVFALRRWRYV